MELKVFGDSKVIVDWENEKYDFQAINLSNWMKKTRLLISQFDSITSNHIYRIFNKDADALSKEVIGDFSGFILFSKWVDESLIDSGIYSVF